MNSITPPLKVSKAFAHVPVRNIAEGLSVGGFPSIGIRGKVWSLKYHGNTHNFVREDDGTPLSYLDVVIVGDAPYTSKIFFPPGEFNEDSTNAPICASVKGDKPDPGVSMPQHKTCAGCPRGEWRTLPTGNRGKECQDHKRLAVWLMPKMTTKMLGSPLMEPVYLKVPPGSLRSFTTYANSLLHQGLPAIGVVTRISFSPDKLFQMEFKAVEALVDAAAEFVLPMEKNPQTLQITGETATVRALPAPEEEDVPAPGGGSNDILEAFGVKPEEPKRQGRPVGSKNKPKQLELQAAPDADEPPPPAGKQNYEEADDELHGALSQLLGRNIQDMLK